MDITCQRPTGGWDFALLECGIVPLDLIGHCLCCAVEEEAGVVVSELILLFVSKLGHVRAETTAGCAEVVLRAFDSSADHAAGDDERYVHPGRGGVGEIGHPRQHRVRSPVPIACACEIFEARLDVCRVRRLLWSMAHWRSPSSGY